MLCRPGALDRITDHGIDDPNPELALAFKQFGPLVPEVLRCPDPQSAALVEGALISAAARHRFNLTNRRLDEYQFTPLGVPADLASRAALAPNTPVEIAARVGGPVVFVYVSQRNLADTERGQIDPLNPSAHAVVDRIRRWWSLGSWLADWREGLSSLPRALVGLSGKPRYRYVTGALDLRSIDWSSVEVAHGQAAFPVPGGGSATDGQLDAFELRGRVVTGVTFSNRKYDLVRLYDPNGLIPRRG